MSQQGKSFATYYTGLIKDLVIYLFSRPKKSVYDINYYAGQQLHVFANIHNKVREKSPSPRVEMMAKQNKKATAVNVKEGDNVMVCLPDRKSKLSPKVYWTTLRVKKSAW